MNSGMQGVTIFLSFIVLTSFLLWVMVGPKCLIQTHVNLIYGRQWSNQTYISTNETNGLNPEKQLFKAEESMSSSRICKPQHKVIFAKTHKTGGTSIQVWIPITISTRSVRISCSELARVGICCLFFLVDVDGTFSHCTPTSKQAWRSPMAARSGPVAWNTKSCCHLFFCFRRDSVCLPRTLGGTETRLGSLCLTLSHSPFSGKKYCF